MSETSWGREMYEKTTEEELAAGRRALLSGSVGGELPLLLDGL